MKPSVYAIIPARAGSKGIPGKNLCLLNGRPLIEHTLQAARSAACVSRILISTDCPEIAAAGQTGGAEVPFLRPAELATDEAPVADAVRHLLERIDPLPDYLLLLQPTSPFRIAEDIDAAFALLCGEDAAAVVGVTEAADHPFLCRKLAPGGVLMPFVENPLNTARRQDLPPAYVLNGAIYLLKTGTFLAENSFCPPGTIAYVMPADRSIDIDTPDDLKRAEFLIKQRGDV